MRWPAVRRCLPYEPAPGRETANRIRPDRARGRGRSKCPRIGRLRKGDHARIARPPRCEPFQPWRPSTERRRAASRRFRRWDTPCGPNFRVRPPPRHDESSPEPPRGFVWQRARQSELLRLASSWGGNGLSPFRLPGFFHPSDGSTEGRCSPLPDRIDSDVARCI